MITSANNTQVKNIIQLNQKAKARREQGLFVAEGRKMFGEAPKDWISRVYVTESLTADESLMKQVMELPEEKREIVADNVFRQMCDTRTPQGILTVLKKPVWTVEDILKGDAPLVMVLEDLQDPGNMGTIFRTAEGAGVDGIFMSTNCVDIYNPKTIRSTMGSVYREPFVIAPDLQDVFAWFKKQGIRSYAAHLKGKGWYDEQSYVGGTAFLIGNEGNGLTDATAGQADCLIRIPMKGQLESLNAGVAAAILMYEASRQRRKEYK